MTVPAVAPIAEEVKSCEPLHTGETCDGIKGAAAAVPPAVGEGVLEGAHSRILGDTEHNWCRAVCSGTGITVLATLFSRRLQISVLQLAVDAVQMKHPRLRSHLLWIEGKPAFQVSDTPYVKVQVVDEDNKESEMRDSCEEREGLDVTRDQGHLHAGEMQDAEDHEWMVHVESELNTNLWSEEHYQCLVPQEMFVVRLHLLPKNHCLLIIRVHTAVCDRVSAGTILVDLLRALRTPPRQKQVEEGSDSKLGCSKGGLEPDSVETCQLMSVEDAIPPGQANKPFWAHGIDLIGYSLGSRRHAFLPFEDTVEPRRSKIIHSVLTVEQTQLLLEACSRANTSVYGVLCAAGLKAAAILKQLARRSEHYALITLIDCRQYLEPKLSESTVGFYHSALMNTHHVNEVTEFWELARRCSSTLENAMKSRKHFTDMGDLNFLMFQALSHPALTPSSSMRTSQLVLFRDPVLVEMEELAKDVGAEHYVGCSSIHGVGPALAIFDSIRKGALHFTGVYPAPLYSRNQMRTYVNTMIDLIVQSSKS